MLTNNYNHPKLKYLNEFITRKDPKEDYRLLKNIGSGTYGEVYKAINRQTNVYTAVKIVKVDIKDDVKAIAQEIHTLRDCVHPNIVKYFGSYLRKNKLWICMEFCGGFSMQDIYTNIRRPLDENCIAYVSRDTLRGLAYMHKQGKIHRDIKGANILLTEDGQVKIADFGVAAQITQTIQKRNSFIGTPYWMAPEVAAVERKGGYDEKCDIWAVGITSIEYAELQPPMFDLHPMKALHILSMRSYKAPVLQNKCKWSTKFQSFIKFALIKNEKKRPDADTMLQHEFVTQKCLVIGLTKNLLQLNKNPGAVPLVPNDDDDEEIGTMKKDQKPEHKPLERILSTRRNNKHSCIDDVRFKINEFSEAPICDEESTNTIQHYSPKISPEKEEHTKTLKCPISPLSVRNEKAEAFSAYNDTSPDDKTSEVVCELVNDNQRLRFAHKYQWLIGLSGDSQNSSDDAPTPPPKKSALPPPLPPLPSNRRYLREREFQTKPIVLDKKPKEMGRRNSSLDLTDISDTYVQDTSITRRFSQIELDNELKAGRPRPPTPDLSSILPPPVPIPKPRSLPSPEEVKPDFVNHKNSEDYKNQEEDNENLYSINKRKAVGVGLPHTPHVPMGACFSLIFEGCPLKINATATWIHPLRNAQIILFGTNEGIYYLSLDEIAEGSLTMLFPRRCLWLYIVKNTMMSLSGQHPQLYNHNLVLLFKLKPHNQTINPEKFSKLRNIIPRRFLPTTKVRETKGCLMVNVTRNPYSGAKYLVAALINEILIMEWFNPVSTFMEVKRVSINCLPTPLLNFDLLIFQERSLPVLCLGVYPGEDNTNCFHFNLLDLNQTSEDNEPYEISCPSTSSDLMIVVKVVQLDYKTVLIAFQNSIVITNLQGQVKNSKNKTSELKFNFVIHSIVCLKDSLLVFHQHGFTGKSLKGQLTQEINDSCNIYRLIGSEKNIVVEKRSIDDPMNDSNIYILAGHTDSS